MPGGSSGFSRGLLVSGLLLGACQSIIGISSYEIDPSLDAEADAGEPSGSAQGGRTAGEGGADGRDDAGNGGHDDAGGVAPVEGGTGGSPHVECDEAADCDDTIDCTVDSCVDGLCAQSADDMLCVPDAGECMSCKPGIGCVARPGTIEQLLLDPSFDDDSGAWEEDSDNYASIIFVDAQAQSGSRLAKLGPAPVAATKQEYADLYQVVSIPANTHGVTLTGFYMLTPGTTKPAEDEVVAALYAINGVMPSSLFHVWLGSSDAQATWRPFSYSAARDEVMTMRGNDFTFDLLAHTVGTSFYFDTLKLEATLCK
jgi:hypothetical protein